jgi:hypothetical protein
MEPAPPWLLELFALITKCAKSDEATTVRPRSHMDPSTGRIYDEICFNPVVMGYDWADARVDVAAEQLGCSAMAEHGEVPERETETDTGFWEARVYPASKDDTVHFCLEDVLKEMEPNPEIRICWNFTELDGRFQGHEVSIELFCATPRDPMGDGDAKPVGLMFDGKPHVEVPAQPMGPDFDADD